MLIESDDIKYWLKKEIDERTIHFESGDYITREGKPYVEMMKYILECEKRE